MQHGRNVVFGDGVADAHVHAGPPTIHEAGGRLSLRDPNERGHRGREVGRLSSSRVQRACVRGAATSRPGGGYCSGAFSGPLDGLWNPRCLPPEPPGATEAAYAREQTRAALSFAGDHLTDLPRVATIRVFRVFGIYKPGGTAFLEAGETRNGEWQRAAGVVTWVLLPFAVAGIVGLVRARRRVAPLLGWGGTALVLVALTNGNGRQRLMFEPVLAILVAAAPLVLARRPRPEIPYVQEPEVVPSRELMSSR